MKKKCKKCQYEGDVKEFAGNLCKKCESIRTSEYAKKKRAERWEFLGLDMSKTY